MQIEVDPGAAQHLHPELLVDDARRARPPPPASPPSAAQPRPAPGAGPHCRPGAWCPACPRCPAWASALGTPSPRRPTSTGTSISPAPCAEAIRNDHSTSSRERDAHADPARVAEAGDDLVGREAEQRRATQRQEQPLRDHQPERADRDGGEADGQRMTEGDRTQGHRHRPQPPLLQTERDGEEPAHPRVQPMKGPQNRQ